MRRSAPTKTTQRVDITVNTRIESHLDIDHEYERVRRIGEQLQSWYLADRRWKRALSKSLRVLTLILAVCGTSYPIFASAFAALPSQLGYTFLLFAAGCYGFDKAFGLSSGWIRDINASSQLNMTLANFYHEWRAAQLKSVPIEDLLAIAHNHEMQILGVCTEEVKRWSAEFQDSLNQLPATLTITDPTNASK